MNDVKEQVGFVDKIRAILRGILGTLGLWLIPYPILIFRRALAGRTERDGDMEFYCHPRFAITSHVIFIGWLSTVGFLINYSSGSNVIPETVLSWPWLLTIALTFVTMGRDWEIISSIIVGGSLLLLTATMVILQLVGDWRIFEQVYGFTKNVPVDMDWGGPFLLSFFLGFIYVLMAAYQRVDDVWRLPKRGNLLDHYRFERSDTSISKGGKTFRADWPCMLKKWFFFGYGNILIMDAHSKRTLHRIEGVFFAHAHAEVLKYRFSTTDAVMIDEQVASEDALIEEEDHSSL